MEIYIKEKCEVHKLSLFDPDGEEISEEFLFLLRDSCLYTAAAEIQEKYGVKYMMYRDDYNECAALLNEAQRLINKAAKQRRVISPELYEKISNPTCVMDYAN
jgi:hypothetical protein